MASTDKKPMEKYENTSKQELVDACNTGKLDDLIKKWGNEAIKNDEAVRDKIVINVILSGNSYAIDTVSSIFEDAGFKNNGRQEFINSVLRLQENENFSAVACAMVVNDATMIKNVLSIIDSAKNVSHSELTNEAAKQFNNRYDLDQTSQQWSKSYMNVLQLNENDSVMQKAFVDAVNEQKINEIVGNKPYDENLTKIIMNNISKVKIKMKELLEDGNYYLVEHNINKADRGQAKEWAKALRIAGIEVDKIKDKINIPLSFIEADKPIDSFLVRK